MLEPILATTRTRIAGLPPMAELRRRAADAPPVRPWRVEVGRPGLSVIAEIKRRSPSRGVLAPGLDPVDLALRYQAGGAAALSVLTEPAHFDGSDQDLADVRAACSLPVLRKDFTLDVRQVWEARALGADAVLLIVAALSVDQLAQLIDAAGEAGVAALVEVHTEPEAEKALEAGASIVGVNNRNLATFEVDLSSAERIAPLLAGCDLTIAESGIHSGEDAKRMAEAGYDAVLVGESLVRSSDPAAAVGQLRVTER